ncbi:hypothetical protein Leryth_007546 [Lithospermum erythrorhizon]|nr:hypothetical protein Leryth_007546 [Lithospermum erythrorhizon]
MEFGGYFLRLNFSGEAAAAAVEEVLPLEATAIACVPTLRSTTKGDGQTQDPST